MHIVIRYPVEVEAKLLQICLDLRKIDILSAQRHTVVDVGVGHNAGGMIGRTLCTFSLARSPLISLPFSGHRFLHGLSPHRQQSWDTVRRKKQTAGTTTGCDPHSAVI